MSNNLLGSMKMAEISLAKVKNVNDLTEEAREAIGNFRVNIRVKEELQQALDNIQDKEDYQITPDVASNIDDVITTNSNLSVDAGVIRITGTESFGISLTPKEWRKTREAALRSMLGETYKNIKRWANQLSENFHRSWVELTTSVEVLETRLDTIDSVLDVVGQIREGCSKIELNEIIVASISKNGKMLSGDLGRALQSEVNFIFSCLKMWEMEEVRYKNSVIKYFGNEKSTDIEDIYRELPKLFNQRTKFDDNQGMLTGKQSLGILDGFAFQGITLDKNWIKNNIETPADNTLYADSLSLTGYHLIRDVSQRVGGASVDILTLNQIFQIRDVIKQIIDRLKLMNKEEDPVNFNPDDVKDVLNTLRNSEGGKDRAYQYGLITSDYQYDVNRFKTDVSGMMIVLASHLTTMLSLHLECYDVE